MNSRASMPDFLVGGKSKTMAKKSLGTMPAKAGRAAAFGGGGPMPKAPMPPPVIKQPKMGGEPTIGKSIGAKGGAAGQKLPRKTSARGGSSY